MDFLPVLVGTSIFNAVTLFNNFGTDTLNAKIKRNLLSDILCCNNAI